MELTNRQLYEIQGGAVSGIGTFINSITKMISTVLELGRIVGSAFSFRKNKYTC
jgi:hypothetical protein